MDDVTMTPRNSSSKKMVVLQLAEAIRQKSILLILY
jgi:hypothetical protein